jgi:hypothetical protein
MLNKFPKNYLQLIVKLSLETAVFAILITLSMSVYGQRTLGRISLISGSTTKGDTTKSVLLNESANLEQCRNGGSFAARVPCNNAGGNTGWVTGNAGASDSHWEETDALPYRMLFDGLTIGAGNTHTVTIGYDVLKGTQHAIDYLTSFDNTETQGADDGQHANQNNPCDGVSGCSLASFTTLPIPADPSITNAAVIAGRLTHPNVMTLYGGTITSISVPFDGDPNEKRVTVTFTANVVNPVLAWGGHVAWQGEWGLGLSAGGISGSPYHMRLKDLDGSGGNQDRSRSAAAVAVPAKLTIVKLVPFALQSTPTVSFSFNVTGAELTAFNLSPVTPSGTTATASTSFAIKTGLTGALADQRSVQESLTPPHGWKVVALGCFNNGPNGAASIASVSTAAQISSGIAIATLAPVQADDIQCTFTNSIVTAAMASITGRVTTAAGYGISGAVITANDINTGARITVLTNPFGYYTLSNMPVNDFYQVSVSSKRYTFSNNTQSLVLNDNFAGLNFVADF